MNKYETLGAVGL